MARDNQTGRISTFTLEVARTMGHVHDNGNYTGLSLPLKTVAQREFAAFVLAALISYRQPSPISIQAEVEPRTGAGSLD